MHSQESTKQVTDLCPVLDNQYRIIETVGVGRFAKVKIGYNIKNNKQYAIKIMRNNSMNSETKFQSFVKEVQILSRIHSKKVIKIKYANLNGEYKKVSGKIVKCVYYVMKFAESGELYQFIKQTPKFSEKLARYYFHQLIEGLEYLHQNNIGHLDIKTENILLDKNFNLILGDFGFSRETKNQKNGSHLSFATRDCIGSPEYTPPDVTNHLKEHFYAEEADIFASGCILFLLVMKSAPFQSTINGDPYYMRFCENTNKFWKIFACNCEPSQEFKDLIELMMQPLSENRLTVEQIKKHNWYNGKLPPKEYVVREMSNRLEIIRNKQKQKLRIKKEQKLIKLKNLSQNKFQFNDSYSEDEKNQTDKVIENLKGKYIKQIQEINQLLEMEKSSKDLVKLLEDSQKHLFTESEIMSTTQKESKNQKAKENSSESENSQKKTKQQCVKVIESVEKNQNIISKKQKQYFEQIEKDSNQQQQQQQEQGKSEKQVRKERKQKNKNKKKTYFKGKSIQNQCKQKSEEEKKSEKLNESSQSSSTDH